jgi:hypothetical protein
MNVALSAILAPDSKPMSFKVPTASVLADTFNVTPIVTWLFGAAIAEPISNSTPRVGGVRVGGGAVGVGTLPRITAF